jgi:hypothetical protein
LIFVSIRFSGDNNDSSCLDDNTTGLLTEFVDGVRRRRSFDKVDTLELKFKLNTFERVKLCDILLLLLLFLVVNFDENNIIILVIDKITRRKPTKYFF